MTISNIQYPISTLTNPKALRLALFYLQSPNPTPSTPAKSILLVISTSGYFGGTGVSAYCASKHGVLGLLRSSQTAARNLGVRVNAIAPFFTPTNITAGFARQWSEHGLEENSPARVAEAIAHVSLDRGGGGSVCWYVFFSFSFWQVVLTRLFLDRLLVGSCVKWRRRGLSFFPLGLGRTWRISWVVRCASL